MQPALFNHAFQDLSLWITIYHYWNSQVLFQHKYRQAAGYSTSKLIEMDSEKLLADVATS